MMMTFVATISLRALGSQMEAAWNKGMIETVENRKETGTTPFPTPPAMWKYRAFYTKDSQRSGQWSNVAEISVGG